jgi:hypothetical protein
MLELADPNYKELKIHDELKPYLLRLKKEFT